MKKNNIFLYELKKMTFLPLILVGIVFIFFLFQLLNLKLSLVIKYDKNAMDYLYIFFFLVVLMYSYKSISERKLYQKVDVNLNKLFIFRIILLFFTMFIFVEILLLLGTIRIALFKKLYIESYNSEIVYFTFSFIGKGWWYFLFGFSVAISSSIIYSIVNYITNVIYSKMNIWVKISSIILIFMIIFNAYSIYSGLIYSGKVISNQNFVPPLPVDSISYKMIDNSFNKFEFEYVYYKKPYFLCYVSWNITNITASLIGLSLVIIGFLSNFIFKVNINESYFKDKEGVK